MDEHLVVTSGSVVTLDHDVEDWNLNGLRWWTNKQAGYAVREVADTLLARHAREAPNEAPQDPSSRRKRWLKTVLYARVPLFVRPAAYFLYRYVLRLGFLDGRAGLIWHGLQGFWYRFLVDAILFDVSRKATAESRDPIAVLADAYGLDVRRAPSSMPGEPSRPS
jgi:hypothetical protein